MAVLFAAFHAGAVPLLRISLENTADHVQVKAVQRFAAALAERTRGELTVEVYPDARLFRDRDVVAALVQGKVEMAVPGTWQLDRYEPAVGILLLPSFYGRDPSFIHSQLAGPLGREIDRRLEASTGTVVLGRWIDLGPIHLFGVKRDIARHEDVAGMRIRIAGGIVNELRLKALGAEPLLIPWPDLPQKLGQGSADGVLTSFESVASARLWEAGIRSAFEDSQYFGQYVPLLGDRFWTRIPEALRRTIRSTWEEHVDAAREAAARAQADARRLLQENGVRIVVPSPASTAAWRRILAAGQPEMIRSLGLDPALARLIPEP